MWKLLLPFLPCRVREGEFIKPALKILPLYTHQPFLIGIPKCSALLIIKNKRVFIGPPRGGQRQCFSVQGTAVHSRKVYQRSVGCGNGSVIEVSIGHLMFFQSFYGIGLRCISFRYPYHSGIIEGKTQPVFEV